MVAVGPAFEIGVNGARAGVGFIGCCFGPLSMGLQTRAGFFWTWGDPWTVEGGQTLAGGEVRINLFPWLVLSPGYYWRLNGPGEAFFSALVLAGNPRQSPDAERLRAQTLTSQKNTTPPKPLSSSGAVTSRIGTAGFEPATP